MHLAELNIGRLNHEIGDPRMAERVASHHFVMWFVPEVHLPDLVEARERLQYLEARGNTDHAFTWSHLEHIKLWQSQKCG